MSGTTQIAANRQFYSIPKDGGKVIVTGNEEKTIKPQNEHHEEDSSLLQYVADNIIGADKTFSGPYGLRKVTYLDYVASGRALRFIEDYINSEVLPEYGNTHTTTSVTSLQTTLYRHEARDILRNSFNASEHDSVIFTGSGTTGAVHKLIKALNFQGHNTVVLVGPYEHHSNILPWKETGAEVVRIKSTEMGHIDMKHLDKTLKSYEGCSKHLIGSFSAASNVTGILSDVDAITICLHKHGALAIWDYACAAPYVKIDMNPYIGGSDQSYVYKDAVVLSMHKFVGGTSTPGVLIAKKKLFCNPVPEGCGGGTVFFVRRENHRYLQEPESREEGGTPAIVQSIRAGLVVQLKQAIGVDTILERDKRFLEEAHTAWSNIPELVLLGPMTRDKLPIFSFLVYHQQTGRFLHHNFVAAVLNDVFGIQARGGCACAGPYAMDLLGLDENRAAIIEELIAEDSRLDRTHLRRIAEYSHREIFRPGFVRLNLPYFMDQECLQFVLDAVKLTAQHAWKLLPQYLFNPETGEWRQRNFQTYKDRKWLGHISYQTGQMKYHQPRHNIKGPLPTSYQDCLLKAKQVFEEAVKLHLKIPDQSVVFDEKARPYRWFVLPSEANACLHNHNNPTALLPSCVSPDDLPFFPGRSVEILTNSLQHTESSTPTGGMARLGLHISGKLNTGDVSEMHKDSSSCRKKESEVEVCVDNAFMEKPDGNDVGKKGGMAALENAIRYADEVLKSVDSGGASDEVSSVMRNIWDSFDPNYSSNKIDSSKEKLSALEEVSGAMSQMWDSFSATGARKTGQCDVNNSSGSVDKALGYHAMHEQHIGRNCESKVDVVNDAVGEIISMMNHISGAFLTSKTGPVNIIECENAKKQKIADGKKTVDDKLNLSNLSHREHTSVKENETLVDSGDARDIIHEKNQDSLNDNIWLSSRKSSKNSASAVEDVKNAMESIWEQFTPSNLRKNKPCLTENRLNGGRVHTGLVQSSLTESYSSCKTQPSLKNDNLSCVDVPETGVQDNEIPSNIDVHNSLTLIRTNMKREETVEEVKGIMDQICAQSSKPESGTEFNSIAEALEKIRNVMDNSTAKSSGNNSTVKTLNTYVKTLEGLNTEHCSLSHSSFSDGLVNALDKGFEISNCDGSEVDPSDRDESENHAQEDETDSTGSLDITPDIENSSNCDLSGNLYTSTTSHHQPSTNQEPEDIYADNIKDWTPLRSTQEEVTPACPLLRAKVPPSGSEESLRLDSSTIQTSKVQWFPPPKQIFKPAVTAMEEYSMLKNGDKVLVCLSGGKDSLSLLHTIRQYQFYAKGKGINFEFGAVTVDPMTPAYDPSPLKQYLASLGVPYFYESQSILETAENLPYECASICSFCSRMKRGRIYAAARREGYNVLALGQHLDDLTESFLMSFFHNGSLNTMKASYTVKQGDLRVIRPFVYVREADLRAFAEQKKLPVISENCPACFEAPKERHRTKQLLAAQEVMFPQVYSSMMAALKPLMARDLGSRVTTQENVEEDD